MNNRENDDELERMRARARRGSGRQDGGRQSSRAYPRPVQPIYFLFFVQFYFSYVLVYNNPNKQRKDFL